MKPFLPDIRSAYYKMETIEHFARISLVARTLGGERLLSREEVMRLQDLRGMYGIAAPAPICPDPDTSETAEDDCQVVEASSSLGQQVVTGDNDTKLNPQLGKDDEIRLTYRELLTLVEDAVKQLRDD